jgi:type I restriction enzyme, S subunit
MAREWRDTSLGEVIRLQRGHDLPDKDRTLGLVPVMGSFGVTGWHNEVRAQGPGVTIGRSGASIGVISFIREDYWPLNTCLYVTDFQGNDPRFCYYWLSTLDLANYNSGSAQPSLNRNYIYGMPVRVPEPEEQRAIAHILGTLDDKIELNRRLNETLEAMARAIFQSWFVNFDPIRAKAEGRDPCLPKDIADLFPAQFEDSELGKSPAGWGVGCVDNEFDLTMGQSPPGDTYNETGEGVPFYQGRADFSLRFPMRRVYCTAATRFAKAGDTLISVRAPVGDINMASEHCAIGRGVAAARHKTGSRSYSYQFMRSLNDVFSRFEAEGTVFGSIGKKDFHAIPCVIPPRDLVVAFERHLSPIDERIEVNERESRTLALLRDTLLPKLISGELPVKDAERWVQESSA